MILPQQYSQQMMMVPQHPQHIVMMGPQAPQHMVMKGPQAPQQQQQNPAAPMAFQPIMANGPPTFMTPIDGY